MQQSNKEVNNIKSKQIQSKKNSKQWHIYFLNETLDSMLATTHHHENKTTKNYNN